MKNSVLAALILALCAPALTAQSPAPHSADALPLFVKVQLDHSVKLSSLKVGDAVDGNLARDVYSSDSKVFAAGSHIRLTVSQVERKRKTPSERWPWVARIFMPHHENSPVFREASISMPDGTQSLVQATLLSANRMKQVTAPTLGKKNRKGDAATSVSIATDSPRTESAHDRHASHGPVLYLEAYQNGERSARSSDGVLATPASSAVVPAGTICRVLLLSGISASKSRAGDAVRARLLEPILSDSHVVLPAGSLFEGRVLKSTPPRMMSRAGSLTISFESVSLPEGNRVPISASVASLALSAGSTTKLDREGRLHGSRPGATWLLVNGGVSAGMDKVVDDTTQLVIEALVSSATDASTAGTARIVGTAVSGIFLLTRRGHDVVLPGHTEMNISLNRPFTLSAQVASAVSPSTPIPQN